MACRRSDRWRSDPLPYKTYFDKKDLEKIAFIGFICFPKKLRKVGSDLPAVYPFISSTKYMYDDEALIKFCFLDIRQQVYVSVNIMVRFDHSNESATGVSELNKSADWHLWTLMLMIVQTYLGSMQMPKSHQNVISKNLCSANLLTVVSIEI